MGKKNIEVDYDFRRYVTCSECGHYLERSLFAKGTQRRCDKCGALLEYTVQGDTVTTKVIEPSKRRKKAIQLMAYQEGLQATLGK